MSKLDKPDKRDFDSHYEYWDKVTHTGEEMSDEKLTEKRLLEKLDEWFETVSDYGEIEDEQAYTQIKEIVRAYYLMVNLESKDFAAGYEQGLFDSKIKQIQQKPTVTREQIEEIIIDIDKAVKATPINYLVSNDLRIATNVLSEWLKVHGIEVMK